MTTTVKKIKAVLNFTKLSDADFQVRLYAVHDGMKGNAAYPSPNVDLDKFKADIDSYGTLMTDALDGGTKAKSALRKQRALLEKEVTLLGHYVEATCNNDAAVFDTSGFQQKVTVRTSPQPLSGASFQYIDRGANSGQVLLKPTTISGAMSYDVRYAAVGAGGTLGAWTLLTLTSPKVATISGLTPGTSYQFQIRALGKLGYTDYSESMTFIPA
jgi:hypothetical protein